MIIGIAMIAVVTMGIPAMPALAYNGAGAANYAETWWNSHNTNYMYISGDDCANFVSQSLHSGGGFSYVGKWGSETDDTLWWAGFNNAGFAWSHSFTVAKDLYNFLILHNPGGLPEGTAHTYAEQNAEFTPDTVVTGDVIFYDFDGDGVIDHTSLQVGIGTDPNSSYYYGNYVDQHTNNRHHAFWSLFPYNGQWSSTTIYFVHVDANNN